jgi:hypothetical protein
MNEALVVTSIGAPNGAMRLLANGAVRNSIPFYVIGDVASPPEYSLAGCSFYNIEDQIATGFRTAASTPKRHYARKNIGYLLAMRDGAEIIIETDDDNEPSDAFWIPRKRFQRVPSLIAQGCANVYRYYSDSPVWPRGLPLEAVQADLPQYETLPTVLNDCPIQQGLADGNPDVDAIYRMVLPLPLNFSQRRRIALGQGTWCPFNSQNTAWWRSAFPLLYLPAHCSFRMTDIWRSFVAQRIAWENGWSLLFHEPTVVQDRNAHQLMRDFIDEVPGYLNNARIIDLLGGITLMQGEAAISENLFLCYEALVKGNIFGSAELQLLEDWIYDVQQLLGTPTSPDRGVAYA